MSFNPALFLGLRGAVTTVTTGTNAGGDGKKNENPSNGAACKVVSPPSPPSPPEKDKSEKNHGSDTRKGDFKAETLGLARGDYFTHKDTCPICSLNWAATASCEEHSGLWLSYHDALVAVHGADLVDGPTELSPEPPASKDAPKGTNGYRTVATAQLRPPVWHRARDTYHGHLMTCEVCKPSGLCNEGRQLRHEYNTVSAVQVLAK